MPLVVKVGKRVVYTRDILKALLLLDEAGVDVDKVEARKCLEVDRVPYVIGGASIELTDHVSATRTIHDEERDKELEDLRGELSEMRDGLERTQGQLEQVQWSNETMHGHVHNLATSLERLARLVESLSERVVKLEK